MRTAVLAVVCLLALASLAAKWLGPSQRLDQAASPPAASPLPAELVSSPTSSPWAQKLLGGVIRHDFGMVPHGAQLQHRFPIKNIYTVPVQITRIRNSCGCLSWTTSHPGQKPLKPQEEGWIDIHVDAGRFTGYRKMSLLVTVGPQYISTAVIEVTADARPDIAFSPSEVDFGIVRQGQNPTRTMELEHTRSPDWRILEVVPDDEAPFTIRWRELYRQRGGKASDRTGKAGYQLAVTLKSDAPEGPFRRDVTLKTNDPQSPVLTVVVQGSVQAPLGVTPSVVHFGTLQAGNTSSFRIAIRGSQPFHILAAQGGGPGLTVELPARAAAVHILTLRYRPEQVGSVRKRLIVRTDLPDRASIAVPIEATVQ